MQDFTHPHDAALSQSEQEIRAERQRSFNMPASWEDCVALGLDPLTGEPA